jgi:hypothetical protein
MDLGNGSRGQWVFIKTMEDILDRLLKGQFDNFARLLSRKRCNAVLKSGQFFSDVFR